MLRERSAFARKLKKIRQKLKGKHGENRLHQELLSLEKRVSKSIQAGEARRRSRPSVSFPQRLPILAKREEIVRAIKDNPVVIISGETGSGKSTQIPKMCLEAGRGIFGKIGCTQPRRIAATTIALRIAEELGEELGQSVGFKIRFRDKTSPDAYIKILTDGMLLAETQGDPELLEYDTIIIDEAHERSLNIDFLLGILRRLQKCRSELKLIITSATLDTEKFSSAFQDAPVLQVGGRLFPVEVEYHPIDPALEEAGEVTYVDMAVKATERVMKRGGSGDVLIFMPTEQDILETCERLEGRHFPGVSILPLFARLSSKDQARVYKVGGRKIVVATNVAETSLTIPGIKYVIDTGLARISRYLPASRTTSLPISPISKSSTDQRKGRCGRVRDGVCIRLYSEENYESRPDFTPPEILRSNLAEVILRMIFLGLGDVAAFPFVDKPRPKSIKDGFDLLRELGAIKGAGKSATLTDQGRMMAKMPLDPRISRMILEAGKEGCVRDVAAVASALSIRDPRERPLDKAAQADQMHAPFKDPDSDFITLLNIWKRYHRTWSRLKTQNKMRKFCKQHFLSFPRMREWVYIHDQINTIMKAQKIARGDRQSDVHGSARYDGIHRSILSGFLSNIAVKKEKNIYSASRGREVMIFPGSTLFNKGPQWIVAAEMVKTSRLFARTAARIDNVWLEALGGGLCRSSYSGPHWEKNRGEVRAHETVTLFGLVIIPRRPISYGSIDPETSHMIFIQSALVEGAVKEPLPFLKHNQELIKALSDMENKLRRRDLLVGDEDIHRFYSERLRGICDIRSLKRLIRERGGDTFLRLKEEDLILSRPDSRELAQYPGELVFGEKSVKTAYKFAPGQGDDGVTVSIPFSLASQIPSERLEWLVPGLFREKVTALIKGLPKRYRKQLVPVSNTVECILEEMARGDRSLLSALAHFIYRRFGVDIPASVWEEVEIPDYLKMRVAITDHKGKTLESGRDIRRLGFKKPVSGPVTQSVPWKRAQKEWDRDSIGTWDFEPLPESLSLGPHLLAYPALEPDETGVKIRLFESLDQARSVHLRGVRALFQIRLKKDLKYLVRQVALPEKAAPWAGYFGGKKALEKALYESLLKDLFQRDLRTREAFDAHSKTVRQIMLTRANEFKTQALSVLEAYHQARSTIHSVETDHPKNKAVRLLCSHIRDDLAALVPEDFLERYPLSRLAHLPRYVQAMKIRAERGRNDPGKDGAKVKQASVFIKAYNEMIKGLSPHASDEKQEALEAFRWMIEEYKVSLFAQELKTPFPVSEKRLEERRREIERMV